MEEVKKEIRKQKKLLKQVLEKWWKSLENRSGEVERGKRKVKKEYKKIKGTDQRIEGRK